MAIYYVDSNAAGLNNGTSWTDAYADLSTALAGSVTTNDTIYCASNHSKTYTIATTLSFPNGVSVFSVNSSTNVYTPGALEEVNNGGAGLDFNLYAAGDGFFTAFYGITLKAEDSVGCADIAHRTYFEDCSIYAINAGAAKGPYCFNDGGYITFKNCTLVFAHADQVIYVGGGSRVILDGCSGSGTLVNSLFAPNGNGGCFVDVKNSDLSTLIAASGNLVNTVVAADDNAIISAKRCKLPTSFAYCAGNTVLAGVDFSYESCDTGDGYYAFYHEDWFGTTQQDVSTYLNATYDGTNGFSVAMSSTANCSNANPLKHKIITLPAQDLTAGATITVEFVLDTATEAALTDTEFWFEAVYNDNTDEAASAVVSTRATDILAAGTAHTASSATWTSPPASNAKYKDTITIPSLVNVDNGVVEIYAYLGVATADVWIDPAVTVA